MGGYDFRGPLIFGFVAGACVCLGAGAFLHWLIPHLHFSIGWK